MYKIPVSFIMLTYTCASCKDKAHQPLTEIIESGTAVCTDCEQDMELDEHVSIVGNENTEEKENGN